MFHAGARDGRIGECVPTSTWCQQPFWHSAPSSARKKVLEIINLQLTSVAAHVIIFSPGWQHRIKSSRHSQFRRIPCHSWSFHVMEQARGVSWGTWLILRKLFKAIARKSSPNYLNLLVSIRFTLLPNSKTRWTVRRRGFPRPCKKQVLRLKNTLPKMAPSRYWAPAPARKAPRLSFSIRAVTW